MEMVNVSAISIIYFDIQELANAVLFAYIMLGLIDYHLRKAVNRR